LRRPGRAGFERVFLANYFAWYKPSFWTSGHAAAAPPSPYDSDDPEMIGRHVAMARRACLDGFALHWFGPDNPTDANLATLLNVASANGIRVAATLQTHIQQGISRGDVAAALRHLHARHAGHPAYLRLGGRPVVFFTNMPRVPRAAGEPALEAWAAIRREDDPDGTALWIAEGHDASYLASFEGLYVYKVAHRDYPRDYLSAPRWAGLARSRGKLWVGTVMPGWNDMRSVGNPADLHEKAPPFAIERGDGAFYRATFEAAAATDSDILLLHSFNEWAEGTMVEPTAGDGDRYLELTAELAMRFRR